MNLRESWQKLSGYFQSEGTPDKTPFRFGERIAKGDLAEVYEVKKASLKGKNHEETTDPERLVKRLSLVGQTVSPELSQINKHNFSEDRFRWEYGRSLKYLKEHFKEYLPEIELVYGHDKDGGNTGYLVTERVHEKDIKTEEEKKRYLEAKDEMLANLTRKFFELEKEQKDGVVEMPDFKDKNDIAYGTTKKNPRPRMYLWDTYPTLRLKRKGFEKILSKVMSWDKGFKFPMTKAVLSLGK